MSDIDEPDLEPTGDEVPDGTQIPTDDDLPDEEGDAGVGDVELPDWVFGDDDAVPGGDD